MLYYAHGDVRAKVGSKQSDARVFTTHESVDGCYPSIAATLGNLDGRKQLSKFGASRVKSYKRECKTNKCEQRTSVRTAQRTSVSNARVQVCATHGCEQRTSVINALTKVYNARV